MDLVNPFDYWFEGCGWVSLYIGKLSHIPGSLLASFSDWHTVAMCSILSETDSQ